MRDGYVHTPDEVAKMIWNQVIDPPLRFNSIFTVEGTLEDAMKSIYRSTDCETCGESNAGAHLHAYPFTVVWLCDACDQLLTNAGYELNEDTYQSCKDYIARCMRQKAFL